MTAAPPAALLAIDAGNTRIKWGVRGADAWTARGVADTKDVAAIAWPSLPAGARAVVSNVAGPDVRSAIEAALGARGVPVAFIASRATQLGVTSSYREPAQLGTDRWAALVAAHHRAGGNKLVVNAGTALTIDALGSDGRFLGGLIVPGPALMRRSLDRGTADLRLTEGDFAAFPASTPEAITSGAIQACAGAIDRMRIAMASRGCAVEQVILSGGAAPVLAPHLPSPARIEENLVLEGLVLIARDS